MKVYILWQFDGDMDKIFGIYDDSIYASECLDACIEGDKEQEYTWMMCSYDVKQGPNTEK